MTPKEEAALAQRTSRAEAPVPAGPRIEPLPEGFLEDLEQASAHPHDASAREGVERAIAAARREGLGDLLQRLKRAVVEDDANDEHRAALHGMDTGAAGMRVDEIDAEETAGDSTSQAPFTPRAERSGAAVPRSRVGPGEFSPD